MKKIVLLYSAGLDSKILFKYAQVKYPEAEVKCLYYSHGCESEGEEITRLPSFVEVRNVDWLGDKIKPVSKASDPFAGAIYIPGRNLVFSCLAASQEIAEEIWLGVLQDEVNPKGTDKNEKFRNDTSKLLTYVLSPFIDKVTVRFPFAEEKWTKVETVKWALENGITKEELIDTVSCWHHKGKPCGSCKQCFKRWFVFKLNGFEEEYAHHPIDSKFGIQMINGYLLSVLKEKSDNRDEVNVCKMIVDAYHTNLLPKRANNFVKEFLVNVA